MAFPAGFRVRTSYPSATPDMSVPRAHVLPEPEMLVGVVELSEAVPPEMEKTKSVSSRTPNSSVVSYTLSENVTVTVVFQSFPPVASVMVGGALSVK